MDLSKAELLLILEILHWSLACKTREDFIALVDQVKRLVPFTHTRSLFGDAKEYPRKQMGAFTMLTAFPEAWEMRYNEQNYFLDDNVAFAAFREKGLLYWGDCARIKRDDEAQDRKNQEILHEAKSVGLADGWIFSMQGRRSSECTIISLAGERSFARSAARMQGILAHLLPHLALAVRRVIAASLKISVQLTRREREILLWTATGKTAWETSVILHISQRTVEFHLGNIFRKLDAVNSQQAIAIACSQGLLDD
ncbi:MAG: LuxR C-terminal-related transcriptional regulator [Desulfopila sp.]